MEYRMVDKDGFLEQLDAFSELYELCFRQPMNHREILWRYFHSPYDGLFACFAFENGKFVANYSVAPIELRIYGHVFPAALSLNTMTHPDFGGRGLFVQLADRVYHKLQNQGYKMVIGFPNRISNRTFLTKLGWHDIYEIPTMRKDLEGISCPGSSPMVTVDNHFLLDYSSCMRNDKICVNKTDEYLRWRFWQKPSEEYVNFVIQEPDGHASARMVCKEYKNFFNIVDFAGAVPEAFEELLRHVISHASLQGKNCLTLWAQIGRTEHLILEKYGFYHSLPVTYFGMRPLNEIPGIDCLQYGNWDIHMCDDNVY